MGTHQVIIIGAGAAGLYCAINAAKLGLQVTILERNHDIGAKIRVSGGGRCNITNRDIHPEAYLSHNPNFCRSAISRHNQWDFLAWFESAGLTYHEKKLGQFFCNQRSRGFLSVLQKELDKHNITLVTDTNVSQIERNSQCYLVRSNQGIFSSKQLVIASGGPSFAKLGATDNALIFAKRLGIANYPFRPALVPLTLNNPPNHLAGISTEVSIHGENSPTFRENLLFTHRGLSGPAILQISSYWQKNEFIQIDFLPDCQDNYLMNAKREHPQLSLQVLLKKNLPSALVEFLTAEYDKKPLQNFKDTELRHLTQQLQNYRLVPTGTEGMKKAEVSSGGIDTRAINPRTMQVKENTGLYVIGEALDVTGWLGGYNLQWAWSSAWCCAQALKNLL